MAKFVLMLRDQGTFGADMSPADIQAVIEKYIAWGEGLRQRGQLHLGEKLRDGEGRVLRPTPGACAEDVAHVIDLGQAVAFPAAGRAQTRGGEASVGFGLPNGF